MAMRLLTLAVLLAGVALPFAVPFNLAAGQDKKAPGKSTGTAADETQLVEDLLKVRKDYQARLASLYEHYSKVGDTERAKWAEDELKSYHLMNKPSYRLDISDVPPASLEAKVNVKEANDLYKLAAQYKDKGSGTEYILNQRRAEILLQEILQKYPNSDKIADVAYELGDLYEGKAFKHYARAAAYFERACQWRKGTRTDARLRAALIYDKVLNERSKAIEMYRDVITNDTDQGRVKEAQSRLATLTATRKN
jgi:tetratricopeptide (TPR) repeat protein